jgi:hypothetical protein
MNETIRRGLELDLTFEQIYFLIVGDTPDQHAIKVLMGYANCDWINADNFEALIKLM